MNRYLTSSIFTGWAMLLGIVVYGQESAILDQYVNQALSNNLSFRSISLQESRQASKVEQAKKQWQPNVDLNATYLTAEGGRVLLFPIGDLLNPAYGTLNQLTGTNQFPTEIDNAEIQLTPNNFIDANLTITKPILNSAIKYNIEIQKALLQLSEVDRQLQRSQLTYQVKQAYYNYLKAEQGLKVLAQNLSLLDDVLAFNKKLIKYDKATPDVISDVVYQSSLLNSQIEGLKEQQALSKILFNTLLNQDLDAEIIIDTMLYADQLRKVYDFDKITAKALAQRPEFKQLAISDEVNQLNEKRINKSNQPTIGLRGGLGMQVQEFTFDDGGPLYTLGLNLGWKIWDGGLRKRKLEEVKINIEENQIQTQIARQQITLEVAQAYYNLRSLYTKLDAEEAAITAAQTSYDAIDKRYRNDRALLIELLSAQSRLTSSQLNKVFVGIDILIAEADIRRITNE